ncbi:MAG: hypothetical protein ACTSP2_09490, partial [Alphaproteobacteria bacterium]
SFANGETSRIGTWSYRDGILATRQDDGETNIGRVVERHQDRFVAAEDDSSGAETTVIWRCSAASADASAGTNAGTVQQSGQSCIVTADELRSQIESRALSGRDAERRLRQAGCGGEELSLCPSGTFGQFEWPACVEATGYRY